MNPKPTISGRLAGQQVCEILLSPSLCAELMGAVRDPCLTLRVGAGDPISGTPTKSWPGQVLSGVPGALTNKSHMLWLNGYDSCLLIVFKARSSSS